MHTRNKLISSFFALNATQFFSALNDNIYKLLLVFSLISLFGVNKSNTILSLAGIVFVIPFLIFASLAGTLADRFSKRSIIIITRSIEIGIVSLGVLSFLFHFAVGGYIVLFLMATQSALFSPAKYGIIPEIVKKEQVSRCNGMITATTYLAIILGTFLASFLAEVTHKNFVLASFACIAIAIFGVLFALRIEKTEPQAKDKKVSVRFLSEIYKTLMRAKRIRYLLPVLIFGAYFLFIGTYVQLNIIPFAFQSLKLSEIQGGYLFLMTAIGIGIGSFFAGRLAGKDVELGFVPVAALGISIIMIGLYFFSSYFFVVVPLLIVLGAFGGFYIVPIDAFIQVASPSVDRGQNVAAGNFLNFLGVIISSSLIAILGDLLEFSAAEGFLFIGILTLFISITLTILLADQVLRMFIARIARLFWKLTVSGRKKMNVSSASLLVAQRQSWIDTFIVMATLPRLIRYIVPIQGKWIRSRKLIYRLVRLIPVDIDFIKPINAKALKEIKKEILLGHSVCLMLPLKEHMSSMKEWEESLENLIKETNVPVLPIFITRTPLPKESSTFQQWTFLFQHPIKVSYGSLKSS